MICEHGNEVSPQLAAALCRMPDYWYRYTASKVALDLDYCVFTAEASALQEQAKKLKLVKKG